MSFTITSERFKKIISGEQTPGEMYSHLHNTPSIFAEYSEDKITISGDFELRDDLIFESEEKYEMEICFDGGNYKNIIFRGGTFKKLFFRKGEFNGYVSIRGGEIDSLILLGGNFIHWLGTIDGSKNKESEDSMLAEEPLKINRFEIEGGSYLNNIWISGGDIKSLEVKCVTPVIIHCKPNDEKLFDSTKNSYENKFKSKPRISNLLISRYSNKSTFYHFNELNLQTLKFENFTNLGNITISKISISDNICFENSDLGKTTFIDCDFSNRKMIFDSSKINEIGLAGTKLPKPKNIDSKLTGNKNQKKLALSQIKKAYQDLGDNLTANLYQSEELNTYKSTLKNGWEKTNLWLNKQTNNHGQRWDRPLALLIIFTAFFYTLFCFSLGFEIDLKSPGNFSTFFKNLSYFFEFLNPFRKSNFIPNQLVTINDENPIPSITVFIDSISKIISAYLLYQFIAAFRKFGKSN